MSGEYITDPALLDQLNASSGKSDYVTDPKLLEQLNAPEAPQPNGAAPQFYPTGAGAEIPQGIQQGYQTAKTIAQPAVSAVGNLGKAYAANPLKLAVDIGAQHVVGVPPTATEKLTPGLINTYQNVKDYIGKTGQFAPGQTQGAQNLGQAMNNMINPSVQQAGQLAANMTPEELISHVQSGQSMEQLATKQTAAKAAQITATQGPAAAEGSNFINSITQKFAPLAARVAPVLNTVGRVAGPAGLAYNAYQAADYAQQAGLGNRLASGEGRLAQQVFHNQNTQYGAPITRDQARAVLQSGNARDIAAFGGQTRLQQLAQ